MSGRRQAVFGCGAHGCGRVVKELEAEVFVGPYVNMERKRIVAMITYRLPNHRR